MGRTRADEPLLAIGLRADERRALSDLEHEVRAANPDIDDLGERASAADASCIVVAHDLPAVDALLAVEALADTDPALPVVVTAAEADDGFVADVVAAGATRYVPRRRGPEAVADGVADALKTGRRRRRRDRDSAMLEEILRRAPLDIYVKDTEARHVRSTKTVLFDDAKGQTEIEYADEQRAARIYEEDLEVLEREEPIDEQLSEYDHSAHDIDDHGSGWLQTWKFPWYLDGELQGLVGFTQDVTGVEQAERELTRKNELLVQFASVVSHDLRNPLNVANGHLQLVREEWLERREADTAAGAVRAGGSAVDAAGDCVVDGRPPEDDVAEAFDAIEESHRRMEEIIEDLIRLTRDSDQDPSKSSVRLATEARRAWGTVETGSASLDVDAELAVLVADEGLLQQVFENLYRNAVEHGEADVTVTVGVEADGFFVEDDGPGLSADVRTRVNDGTFNSGGLGLNIVRTIADRHDWSVSAGESEAGGARFVFGGCRLISNPWLESTREETQELTDERSVGEVADGDSRLDGDRWTVVGRGRNLWRNVNEFHFRYGAVRGDADLVGRLAAFTAAHKSAKAGLMVRGCTDEGSPHAFVGCTNEQGSESLWQLEADAGTQAHRFGDVARPPIWYRLKREGDVVTLFVSPDGEDWRPIDEQRIRLGERALYGLAVTSHDDATRATATFEDVSLERVSWD